MAELVSWLIANEYFNATVCLTDSDAAQLVIPFGVGKRRCVGENLARQELSLLIGRLLQQFEIYQDPAHPVNIHDAMPGLTRGSLQVPLIFKKIIL